MSRRPGSRAGVGCPPYRFFIVASLAAHAAFLFWLPADKVIPLVSRGDYQEPGVAGENLLLPVSLPRSTIQVIQFEVSDAQTRSPARERRVRRTPQLPPPPAPESPELEVEVVDALEAQPLPTAGAVTASAPRALASREPHALATGGAASGSGADTPEAVVVPPVLIGVVWPEAPKEARRRRDDTPIRLMVHVLASGEVGDVLLAQPSGCDACDQAALQAARRLRFRPAVSGGQAIDAWVSYTVSFKR